jgi:hypothetical protein
MRLVRMALVLLAAGPAASARELDVSAGFVADSATSSGDSPALPGGAIEVARWWGRLALVAELGAEAALDDGSLVWGGVGVRAALLEAHLCRNPRACARFRFWMDAGVADVSWHLASGVDTIDFDAPRAWVGTGLDMIVATHRRTSLGLHFFFRVQENDVPRLLDKNGAMLPLAADAPTSVTMATGLELMLVFH